MNPPRRSASVLLAGLSLGWAVAACLTGCASTAPGPSPREAKARYQFNHIMRTCQVAAEDATNEVDRVTLLNQAARSYQQMARDYSDVPRWAAASLRSLGQIHVAQDALKEALSSFDQVGQLYPGEHWEVIQSWKAAGDALWNARHRGEAALYYRQIVDTYGRPGQPPMFDTIVGIARGRLKEQGLP